MLAAQAILSKEPKSRCLRVVATPTCSQLARRPQGGARLGLTSSPALLSFQTASRIEVSPIKQIESKLVEIAPAVQSDRPIYLGLRTLEVCRAFASVPVSCLSLPRPSSLIGLGPPWTTCFFLYIVLSAVASLLHTSSRLVSCRIGMLPRR